MSKPAYRLTRHAFWSSFVFAWAVIGALVVGALLGRTAAVDLAAIALPSMAGLIAALLGIHRGFGSMDMRSSLELERPLSAPGPPDFNDFPGGDGA